MLWKEQNRNADVKPGKDGEWKGSDVVVARPSKFEVGRGL